MVKTIYNDESFIETEYDEFSRVISETNQVGQTRTFEYDEHSRLEAVELPDVWDPVAEEMIAPRYEYGYDDFGNQTLIRDPLGRETRFTFDSHGNQLTRTLPLGFGPDGIEGTGDDATLPEGDFTEHMQYDALGRPKLAVSFEGVVTEFVYDEETGRLSEQRFFDNLTVYDDGEGTPGEVWSFTYDAFGREVEVERNVTGGSSSSVLTSYDAQGRAVRIESPEGIITYAYDLFGRRTKRMIGEANAPTSETQYRYDALGRLVGVDVVKRNGVTIDNDPITAGNQPETTGYRYDLVGNLDRTDNPNGVVTDYIYDNMNRLDKLIHYAPDETPENLANNDKIAEFDYTVRGDGRRTGVVEKFWVEEEESVVEVTNTISWNYDDLNRLIDEVFITDADTLLDPPSLPAGTRAWTDYTNYYVYDLVGNRLEKTTDLGNDTSIDETIE